MTHADRQLLRQAGGSLYGGLPQLELHLLLSHTLCNALDSQPYDGGYLLVAAQPEE